MKTLRIIPILFVAFFFCISPLFLAQAAPSRGSHQSGATSSLFPAYFQDLPRTKVGLKRFLMTYCADHLPLDAIVASSCDGGYPLCLALAKENPADCQSLSRTCGSTVVNKCRQRYSIVEMFSLAVRDPAQFRSSCKKIVPMISGGANPSQVCSLMRQAILSHWSPDRLCRELTPLGVPHCAKSMRVIGKPEDCSRDSTTCKASASVVKAVSSRSMADCGDSTLCMAALSHSAEVCRQKNDSCSPVVFSQLQRMLSEESRFRKYNHLPPHKDGDLFLNYLPPQEKEKYYNKTQERKRDQSRFKGLRHAIPAGAGGDSSSNDSGE